MLSTKKILAKLSAKGTCTAQEIAAELGCSVGNFLHALHNLPWLETEGIEMIAGAGGFTYRVRPIINPRTKMSKEVGDYIDIGINKRSPYMTT
jgi:hypothetical protein